MSSPAKPARQPSAPLNDPRSTGSGPPLPIVDILGLRGTKRR